MSSVYDLIVIGAGPAGISAAIHGGQLKLQTLLIQTGADESHAVMASNISNYPGVVQISHANFHRNALKQAKSFGVEMLPASVSDVDFTGDIKTVYTSSGEFRAMSVIIATGVHPRYLGFEGETEFRGCGVGYRESSDAHLYNDRDIFVVGGSFNAAEEAIFLTRYARQVHVIVRSAHFNCAPAISESVMGHSKIKVHFQSELVSIAGVDYPQTAQVKNNKTGEVWTYNCTDPYPGFAVFVFAGTNPSSIVFEGKVALDAGGYIPTDVNMMTNVPGVFAVGDVRSKSVRQLTTSVSDGTIAAVSADRHISRIKEGLNHRLQEMNKKGEELSTSFESSLIENLRPVLQRFEKEVTIRVILTGEDEFSNEIKTFVTDFAALSDKVSTEFLLLGQDPVREQELNTNLYPAIAILDENFKSLGILFHGVPSGHEFNSFVLALYNVAGPGQEITPEQMQDIMSLPAHNVKVAVSLSCTVCPDAVQAAHLIAKNNPGIQAEMVDLAQFTPLREKYKLLSVPAILVDDKDIYFGRKGLEEMINILKNN